MASRLPPHARALRKRMTPEEVILWARLRRLPDWKFRRQQVIGEYIVDFACFEARLIIELDGSHHSGPQQKPCDDERDARLRSQGFSVLRFWNSEVHFEMDGVIDRILQQLDSRR